jgi:hypothetical protein
VPLEVECRTLAEVDEALLARYPPTGDHAALSQRRKKAWFGQVRTASDYRNGDEATALAVDLETADMDELQDSVVGYRGCRFDSSRCLRLARLCAGGGRGDGPTDALLSE